jgi:hypothetical protein
VLANPGITVYLPSVKAGTRPRRRRGEPVHAADVVSAVVASIGGDRRAREQKVFAVYEAIAGSFLRDNTRVEALRDATLVVRVPSSAIAHHVTLLRGAILHKMAPLLPPAMVTDLRTRVGELLPASPARARTGRSQGSG